MITKNTKVHKNKIEEEKHETRERKRGNWKTRMKYEKRVVLNHFLLLTYTHGHKAVKANFHSS